VEDVVVPLPNKFSGTANKLGRFNWKEHVRTDKGPNFTASVRRIALLMGAVIAVGL